MKITKENMHLIQISAGRNICVAREKMELTQHDLSQATGISVGNISNIERGKVMPSLRILIPIVKALKLSIDDLYLK